MKKAITLNIEHPCDQDWDKMDQVLGGRHCEKCKTKVVDFTGMSDTQLYLWLMNNTGNVCGNIRNEQLNKLILEPPKPKKHFLLSRILAAFSLLFTQSITGSPQKPLTQIQNSISKQNNKDNKQDSTKKIAFNNKKDLIIRGKILDKDSLTPIKDIEIFYVDKIKRVLSDSNGNFEIRLDTLSIVNNMSFIIMGEEYMEFRFNLDSSNIPENLVFYMEKYKTNLEMHETKRNVISITTGLMQTTVSKASYNNINMGIFRQDPMWSGR